MPLAVLLGVLVSVVTVSWNWIGQQLNASLSQSPADRSGLDAARAAFARGDLDTAIDLAQGVLSLDPDDNQALSLAALALVYRSYSDYNHAADRESALQLTTDAANRHPGDLAVLAIHAYVLQANGLPVLAAQVAGQVVERDPDNTLARVALGLSYGAVGSFEIALRESLEAVENGDWRLESYRALAITYSDLGNYTSAIKAVEQAIDINDRLLPLYFERALYALQIGDADSASAAYFQILAFDPGNVKARLRLCELSSLLREHRAALDYCQQVTELAPSWADGWYQLGREFFLQGDFPAAQRALHRCSSLQVMQDVPVSERRFECWYLQGQAAEILGDCPALVSTYNEFRAMAADPAVKQTWTYPPEGPPTCVTPAP